MALIHEIERKHGKGRLFKNLIIVILCIGIPVQIFPFVWTLLSAFKDNLEIIQSPPTFFPSKAVLDGFISTFQDIKIQKNILNTFIICFGVILVQVTTSALAAYSLSKLKPKFGKIALLYFLGTMMINAQALIFPSYLMISEMNLINSKLSVVLIFSAWAYTLYLFKGFFDSVPNELIEAADIDGASKMQVFMHIIIPLSQSVVAVNVLMTFMSVYNQFIFPFILLPDPEEWTIMVRIYAAQNSPTTSWNTIMSMLIVATVPILALYLAAQRKIVEGVALTGIKG